MSLFDSKHGCKLRGGEFDANFACRHLYLSSAVTFGQPAASSPNEGLFNEKIAPVLKANCAGCHGAASPAGGLSMASLSSVLSGGKHGPAIEPGIPGNPC